MPVSHHHAGLIADKFIAEHKLKPEVKGDLVRLAHEFTDDDRFNDLVFRKWIEGDDIGGQARDHVKIEPEKLADERINIEAERKAFGPDGFPAGRIALAKLYGPDLFEQRLKAWGAHPGIMDSGTEPGIDQVKVEIERKASEIAEEKRADAQNPFNPDAKMYVSAEARANACAKWVTRFGTKSARDQCVKFGTDIAGRVLKTKPRR